MKKTLLKAGIIVIPLVLLLSGYISQVRADDHPYGWSPQTDSGNQGPPTCTSQGPKAPILYQPNHSLLPKAKGRGEIRLQWTKVPGADNYSVFYGLTPHNYIFSAPDVGDTDNFTVGHLGGRTYYFAVLAKGGCASGPLSNEWYGRPGGGGVGGNVLAAANGFVPVQKTFVPAPTEAPVIVEPTGTNVQGVESEKVYTPPTVAYQPPAQNLPPAKPVVPPKKSLWQTIISILFGTK